MPLTLEEAMNLNGIEDWVLTPEQQKFLIESTARLVKECGEDWVKKHQVRLQQELEIVFNEI